MYLKVKNYIWPGNKAHRGQKARCKVRLICFAVKMQQASGKADGFRGKIETSYVWLVSLEIKKEK